MKSLACSVAFLGLVVMGPVPGVSAAGSPWWWDPARPGQGVGMYTDCGDTSGVLYYYDSAGRPRWATFTAAAGAAGFSGDLLEFRGPAPGDTWTAASVAGSAVGRVSASYPGSDRVRFEYRIGDQGATLELVPFVTGPAGSGDRAGLWWDAARPGQALMLARDGSTGAWYVYDSDGSALWTVFSGELSGACARFDLIRYQGPPLGAAWDASLLAGTSAGSGELCFTSADVARFDYVLQGQAGRLELTRYQPDCGTYADMEQDMHAQINAHRQSVGLAPLAWNAGIADISRAHSEDMASGAADFGHDGFSDRAAAIGRFLNWSRVGENVAYNLGYSDPVSEAVEGLLNSPGHRSNIQGNYTTTGIGVAVSPGMAYYFTQIFVRAP